MEFTEFLKQVMEAGRFKTNSNIMDRHIKVSINGEYVGIEEIKVDFQGDIIINVDGVE